jgi:acyl-CoA thioester hydrolase
MIEFDPLARPSYPHLVETPLRYADIDRQGHLNNAVYATLFEHGRTLLFAGDLRSLLAPGREPVVARLVIDFRGEVHWPGTATVGTAVLSIGTTSVKMAQAVFEGERCAASGETVIVQIDGGTRRPTPWSEEDRAALARFSAA